MAASERVHDEGGRLFEAILADPDDDTLRLVYADWLEESGDSDRAEFIRLQIERNHPADAQRKKEREIREAELLERHGARWAEPVVRFCTIYKAHHDRGLFTFRRGFVERILTDPDILLEFGDELFRQAPIREIRFAEPGEYERLARCKHLLRLRSLDLTGTSLAEEDNPGILLRSRYLANLTRLAVQGVDDNGHLDLAGVRALVASKYLGNLEALSLRGNWLNQGGDHKTIAYFLRKAHFPALRELNLSWTNLEDADAVTLAATPWMARLRILNLAHNSIGDVGARALLESPYLEAIELLDLRTNSERRSHTALDPITSATKAALSSRFGDRVLQTPAHAAP